MPATVPSPVVIDGRDSALLGARLRWKRYRPWTGEGAPGSCLGCGEPFTEGGAPGLTSGYAVAGGGPAGQDDYLWLCAICYEGLRDRFGWVVLDTRDRVMRPAGLWESTFGFEGDVETSSKGRSETGRTT